MPCYGVLLGALFVQPAVYILKRSWPHGYGVMSKLRYLISSDKAYILL